MKGHYISKKLKLLKDFDRTASLLESYLVKRYGKDLADRLYKETRQEYEKIIPDIPYINDFKAGALNAFLIIVAQELAVYRIMKEQGKDLQETWEICHEGIKISMKKFPKIKQWLLKKIMFSNFMKKRVEKRAQNNEQLKFGDFEVKYIIGDGKEFDWGVDYVACGHYTFLKDQGAEEFAPYVCLSDMALGDALEWGLIRTQTIADGRKSCDFRFKKGSKTRISSKTPEIQRTIEIIQKNEAEKSRRRNN